MRGRAFQADAAARRRSMLRATAWLFVFISFAVVPTSVRGAAAKEVGDERTFTAHMARLVTEALPAAKVRVQGALALLVDGLATGSIQMNLDNLYAYCRRAPEGCDERAGAYVAQAAALFRKMATPLKPSDLRAVVRDTAYVENAEKLYKGDPIAEPLVGDLWVLCVIDLPGAVQILSPAQLSDLKLSADEALSLCKKNVAANLPPLAPARRDYPWAGVNLVAGDPYDASWLIFPERWAAIARSLQGDLLVAAPGVDTLVYSGGQAADSVAGLAKAASLVAAKAQKPLSTAV